MANVTTYVVEFHGGKDGESGTRMKIYLYNGSLLLGSIRFFDAGRPVPEDAVVTGNKIVMNLPSSTFQSVLDVLRNEAPIFYDFAGSQAWLQTSKEIIGEGDG